MPTRRPAWIVVGVLLAALAGTLAGCQHIPGIGGQPEIRCGRFEGQDCNDLLEVGLDAVADGRLETPLVIAVGGACPDNARCVASALGGETAAVVVRWPDGTMDWAAIPLPADWPASPPGRPEVGTGPPPEHLQALVGAGG